ncbi:MAG: PAS domain S-box protein, partial [Deltaproteobacteria bacterium]|nr:PAS domain S-box protein [Deltaproteobacteria bacterium]
ESLRQREELHRTILQTTRDGFWMSDVQGRLMEVNKAYCEMSGYSEQELLAMSVADFEYFKTPDDITGHIQKILTTGMDRFETRHCCKGGRIIEVEISAHYLPWKEGRIVGFLRDITLRKQTEESLRESEARFRLIYEHMAVGIAKVSLTFRIESANAAYCRMLGYREEELIGKHLKDITHTEIIEDNFANIYLLASGEIDHFRMEKRLTHKDGHTIYVILDANLIRDNKDKPAYLLGSLVDITDRKRMEDTLRESEAIESALLNAPTDAIFMIGQKGIILNLNDETAKRLGKIKEDIIGTCIYDLLPPDVAERRKILINEVFRTGRSLQFDDERDNKYIFNNLYPIFDAKRKVSRLAVYGIDITERKRMEEEKERLRKQLLQAQKMEAIGTLAGGIAHDFNNILSAIIGYTELILMDTPEGDSNMEYINNVLKAGSRAKDLVDQILRFSRRSEQERIPLDLQPIIKEALKLMRASLPATITIKQKIKGKSSWVIADPTKIYQVLMNL